MNQQFDCVHVYDPDAMLVRAVARWVPGVERLTNAQCLSLLDEAKAATPEELKCGLRSDCAEWMAQYIRAKLKTLEDA